MDVPSRLNEYPVGTTRPTTGFAQPRYSSFAISRGRADSDEEVPSTMRISSPMYLRNFSMLKPTDAAIDPSTMKMKNRHVAYTPIISLPRETSEPSPYRPTVKAIAPNAPRGA